MMRIYVVQFTMYAMPCTQNTIIGFNFTCFGFTAIFGLSSLFLYSILLAPFRIAITLSKSVCVLFFLLLLLFFLFSPKHKMFCDFFLFFFGWLSVYKQIPRLSTENCDVYMSLENFGCFSESTVATLSIVVSKQTKIERWIAKWSVPFRLLSVEYSEANKMRK